MSDYYLFINDHLYQVIHDFLGTLYGTGDTPLLPSSLAAPPVPTPHGEHLVLLGWKRHLIEAVVDKG